MPSTLNLQQCTHGVNIRYLYKFLPKLGFPVYVKHFCSVSSHMDCCWEGRGWEWFACVPVRTISVCCLPEIAVLDPARNDCYFAISLQRFVRKFRCVGYRLLLKPDVQELFSRNISGIEWKRVLQKSVSKQRPAGQSPVGLTFPL